MSDPPFRNKPVRRLSHGGSERLPEVMGAQSCNRGELDQPKLIGQMRIDVIKDASHLPRRKPALVSGQRTL